MLKKMEWLLDNFDEIEIAQDGNDYLVRVEGKRIYRSKSLESAFETAFNTEKRGE